jgi:hypothetical protein
MGRYSVIGVKMFLPTKVAGVILGGHQRTPNIQPTNEPINPWTGPGTLMTLASIPRTLLFAKNTERPLSSPDLRVGYLRQGLLGLYHLSIRAFDNYLSLLFVFCLSMSGGHSGACIRCPKRAGHIDYILQ